MTTTPRRGLRTGLAVLAVSAAMAAFAPMALAQSDSQGDAQGGQGGRPHPQLTEEQKACLKEAGVEKPADGQPPTDEQRAAFREAAKKCDIPLPRHRHPKLTDEQKACLEQAGVQKPAEGQRPTEEQRAAFRAAAEQCGIQLPERPDGPPPGAPGDAPQGGDQNQSTSV
jgi:hypothetical protein